MTHKNKPRGFIRIFSLLTFLFLMASLIISPAVFAEEEKLLPNLIVNEEQPEDLNIQKEKDAETSEYIISQSDTQAISKGNEYQNFDCYDEIYNTECLPPFDPCSVPPYCFPPIFPPNPTPSITVEFSLDVYETNQPEDFIINGTVSIANTPVSITINNQIYQTVVSGTNWTLTLDGNFADGNYSIITASATSGQSSDTDTASLLIDTTPPEMSFSDDFETNPVTSDIIEVVFEDINPNIPQKLSYTFTGTESCPDDDSYSSQFLSTETLNFDETDAIFNGSYLCVEGVDRLGNTTVIRTANPLNIEAEDNIFTYPSPEVPFFTVVDDVDGQLAIEEIVRVDSEITDFIFATVHDSPSCESEILNAGPIPTNVDFAFDFSFGVNGLYLCYIFVDVENQTAQFQISSNRFNLIVQDFDGVDTTIEDGAPNNGDGNRDGIQDSTQNHVASLISADNQTYMTVIGLTPTGEICDLYDVFVMDEATASIPDNSIPSVNDNEYDYPFGVVYFEADCELAAIRIIFDTILPNEMRNYRKITFKTPNDPGSAQWIDFPAVFSDIEYEGRLVTQVFFTLVDGVSGDLTGIDGIIIDPGGVGIRITPMNQPVNPTPLPNNSSTPTPVVAVTPVTSTVQPTATIRSGGEGMLNLTLYFIATILLSLPAVLQLTNKNAK